MPSVTSLAWGSEGSHREIGELSETSPRSTSCKSMVVKASVCMMPARKCIDVVAGTPLKEYPSAVVRIGVSPIHAPKMTDCTPPATWSWQMMCARCCAVELEPLALTHCADAGAHHKVSRTRQSPTIRYGLHEVCMIFVGAYESRLPATFAVPFVEERERKENQRKELGEQASMKREERSSEKEESHGNGDRCAG